MFSRKRSLEGIVMRRDALLAYVLVRLILSGTVVILRAV